MTHWIKCTDKLPELEEDVLLWFDDVGGQNMAVGFLGAIFDGRTIWFTYSDYAWPGDCRSHRATHSRNMRGPVTATVSPCIGLPFPKGRM